MAETWLPVAGYEAHYEVSDLGRVRVRTQRRAGYPAGTVLRPSGSRYPNVVLYDESGLRRSRRLHLLVLMTFVGPRPDGMLGRHLDGDPHNNALTNLRWGTHAENVADAVRHGHIRSGLRHHAGKLPSAAVVQIRSLLSDGVPQRQIAARFGVCQQHVSDINIGRRRSRDV